MYNWLRKLPSCGVSVKVIITTYLILLVKPTFSGPFFEKSANCTSIILSIGQHKEIRTKSINKYTLSNKDVVVGKMQRSTSSILVKGKKIGVSELITWSAGQKSCYRFFVLSKKSQLKFMHTIETLQHMGIDASLKGGVIYASGEINRYSDYKVFKETIKDTKSIISVQLSDALRKKLLEKVYRLALEEYIDSFKCTTVGVTITCSYSAIAPMSNKLKRHIEDKYKVELIELSPHSPAINYRVKLKIVQLERLDGLELGLGISSINTTYGDIFTKGLAGIIDENRIAISKNNIKLSTLSEPSTIIQVGGDATIEVGAEIPYMAKSKDSDLSTSWKFAGIKVDLKLKRSQTGLIIDYMTNCTRPTGRRGHISGNRERSSAFITPNTPLTLFQIALKTAGSDDTSLPLLGDIPILGRLFSSTSKQSTYKQITGVIILEPYEARK